MSVSVERREPVEAVVVRATTTLEGLGTALEDLLPAVWERLAEGGIAPAGPPFTRYLRFEPDALEIEAGFPVTAAPGKLAALEPPYERVVLPGGELAVCLHEGPYDRLGDAHEELDRWLRAEGRVAVGPVWESYVTDPGLEPEPSAWRTEVTCPLAPAGGRAATAPGTPGSP